MSVVSSRELDLKVLLVLRKMRPTVVKSLSPSYRGGDHLCPIFHAAQERLGFGDDPMIHPDFVIGRRLEGLITYGGWVCDYHPDTYYEMCRVSFRGDRRPFQEGRLQWLDSLIAEYEEKTR